MSENLPERDWKYIRSVFDELLENLCETINKESVAILNDPDQPARKKYQALYTHIKESDRIIAACFDDHRRSTLIMRLCAMQAHDVLTPEYLAKLSPETRRILAAMKELAQK